MRFKKTQVPRDVDIFARSRCRLRDDRRARAGLARRVDDVAREGVSVLEARRVLKKR